jgi:hypothetical protein
MAFIKISREEVIMGGADCIKKSSMLCTPHDKSGNINGRGLLKI